MTKVTVAPITPTAKGLSSGCPIGRTNGIDHDAVVSLDNVLAVPSPALGRTLGFLTDAQERALMRAIVLAFDLDAPLLR